MNYYKQVAKMFSVKLNEEFILADTDGHRFNDCTYMITELGLLYSTDFGFDKSSLLDAVMRGDLVVKKLPWKPKADEFYYYYSPYAGITCQQIWINTSSDYCMWKLGNCFRTKEEAETKGKEIMEKIEKEYRES